MKARSPHVLVVGVVKYEGSILLGKKSSDRGTHLAGRWYVPGTTLAYKETDEAALHRGILFEAGVPITIERLLAVFRPVESKHVIKWYECKGLDDKITARKDVEKMEWIPKNQVYPLCHTHARRWWPPQVIEYFRS